MATESAIRAKLKELKPYVYLDAWSHYDGGIGPDEPHRGGIEIADAVVYLADYPDMGYLVSVNTGGYTGVNVVVVNASHADVALQVAYEWYVSYYYEGNDDKAPEGEGPLRVDTINVSAAANPRRGVTAEMVAERRRLLAALRPYANKTGHPLHLSWLTVVMAGDANATQYRHVLEDARLQLKAQGKAANPKKRKPAKKSTKRRVKAKSKGKRRKNPNSELAEVDDSDIKEALARPDSFGYSGELPLFTTWSLGPVVNQRDATVLGKANWKALEQALEKHPQWKHDWEITGSSHWAVGWVDHLSFKVIDDRGEPTDIFRFLKGWFDALSDYPVASDDIFSEMEFEAYSEGLEQDLNDLERSKLREGLPKKWRDKFYDALQKAGDEWHYASDGTPYEDEARLEEIARELGYLDEELAENPEAGVPYIIFRDPATTGLVGGHFLGLDPKEKTIYIFDEVFQSERAADLKEDDRWVFRDNRAERFDVLAVVTPRGDRVENASESVIGPGLGAWMGFAVGGTAATLTSAVLGLGTAAGMLVGWTLSSLGAATGGYMAADEDRKRRVAIGGGVGSAVFPILGIGAALGGWIGGKKPDPREVQDLRKRRSRERKAAESRANARGYTNNAGGRSMAKAGVRQIKNRVLR